MKKYRWKQFLVGTIVLSLLFIVADELLARAGGGGGFRSSSGGGFSGGGSGGSGGGDGGALLIYLLIRLVFEYPVIGIPLLIVVIIFFVIGGKQGHTAHVSRTISRTYRQDNTQRVIEGENKLRERDAAFNRESFLDRIKSAFGQIQNGWAQQDMSPVRHLVSDGIFERFSLQFEIQRGSGIRNEMKDIQLLNAEIADIESDRFFDTIHVKITARAVDYFVRLDNGKRISGSTEPECFTEYWSFLRRPGVPSRDQQAAS